MNDWGPLNNSQINTLRSRRNRRYFADDFFKRISMNENVLISIKISLKFIAKDPVSNIPALIQIMAWRRPGDKPLSKPMVVRSLTNIRVTRPQWVNWSTENHWVPGISVCSEYQIWTCKSFVIYATKYISGKTTSDNKRNIIWIYINTESL